ncbi:hypothetical protein [Deinococcus kurensis]|uniref:hypothetical protein n=1 Tax=Deinococcus kurensis TaxID=2662757 RepID=UPI0012D2CFAC|nr:hypothetical protein [Deinococcus kurensis]
MPRPRDSQLNWSYRFVREDVTYVVELHHDAEDRRTVHLVPVDEVGAWAEEVYFTSRPVAGRELRGVSPLERDLFVLRLFDEPVALGAHGEWFADQELADGPWVTLRPPRLPPK